jgi:hypothetical protein
MCSIHIDEPVTGVNYCVAVMSLCTFFWKAESSVYLMHDARFMKQRPWRGASKPMMRQLLQRYGALRL